MQNHSVLPSHILLKLMSVVALVIAPSIAMEAESITAHNMESIQVTEQVVISETSAEDVATDEKTVVVESGAVVDNDHVEDKKEDSVEDSEK